MGMVALHFCEVTLIAKKPLSHAYPKTLQTLGDHLRKKRLDLKIYQKDVASIIGVEESTIHNWEKDLSGIAIRVRPKIIQFLGYNPFPMHSDSLGQRIRLYRKTKGLSQKNFAKILRIDPTTLARWESGKNEPSVKLKEKISTFLDNTFIL